MSETRNGYSAFEERVAARNADGERKHQPPQIEIASIYDAMTMLERDLDRRHVYIHTLINGYKQILDREIRYPDMDYIKEFFGLESHLQVFILAYMVTKTLDDDYVRTEQIIKDNHLASSLETQLAVRDCINHMTRYRLIEPSHDHHYRGRTYQTTPYVIEAIMRNDKSILPGEKRYDTWHDLMKEINEEIDNANRRSTLTSMFWTIIAPIREGASSFDFWKKLEFYSNDQRVLMMVILNNFFFQDNIGEISKVRSELVFQDSRDWTEYTFFQIYKSLQIYRDGLIEHIDGQDFESGYNSVLMRLTKLGEKFFFGDEAPPILNPTKKLGGFGYILPKDIKQVPLFFNEKNQAVVDQVLKLTDKENMSNFFKLVDQRPGLNKCISLLLSGPPGTGKTELAMQLARMTDRPVMKVDLSSVKDKYVGESEASVKRIFSNYRHTINTYDVHPVLLLNEADGLLSSRMEVSSAVNQMYNTMQNIMLNEFDEFEGIIIATTNLVENLDRAFDRRFMFKMRLERPDPQIRASIWQSIYPDLDPDWALELSKVYDLSGGQIKNVAFRALVAEALGQTVDLPFLMSVCEEEQPSQGKIGF